MKIVHIVALVMILLLVGCAGKEMADEAPAEAPAAPAEEAPAAPVEAPAEEAPAEAAAEEETEAPVGGDIQILNRAFEPEELTVAAGSTVTWVNMDDKFAHSVSLVGAGPLCNRAEPGETCEHTFEEPGTYQVMDLVNKFRGTIIVE